MEVLQWATQRPRCPTVDSLSGVPSGATNKRVESPGMSPGLLLLLGEQRMLQWGLSALRHVAEESFSGVTAKFRPRIPILQGEGLVRLAMSVSPSTSSAARRLLDGPLSAQAPLVGAKRPVPRTTAAIGPTVETRVLVAPEANGTAEVTCTTPELRGAENKSVVRGCGRKHRQVPAGNLGQPISDGAPCEQADHGRHLATESSE